jgi:hypothetical protein
MNTFPDRAPFNPDVLSLDADAKAVIIKNVRETISNLGIFAQMVEKNNLVSGTGKNILYIAESAIADICKATGIEIDSAAEREDRYAKIRAANIRIRQLEQQIGAAVSTEHVQMGIQDLGKKLNSWWDLEGFGHISSINFTGYGNCEVVFSCMLFGTFKRSLSKTPVSDKENDKLWRDSLTERGYQLTSEDGDRDSLLDCDATRETLCNLFKERLPSCVVTGFTNHGDRKGIFTLRDVKVFIYNLSDIVGLPQMPNEE